MRILSGNLALGRAQQAAGRPATASPSLMVCAREHQDHAAEPTKQEITDRLLGDRVEQASRQLQRDLRRRAVLDLRS